VPHRLVLVGVGPGGFPPATAYRVEHALRRAGIRASVEVLVDGVEPTEYHREAMRNARQVPFVEHGSSRPRIEPSVEAPQVRAAAFEEAPRAEPMRTAPPRVEAREPYEPPVRQESFEPPRMLEPPRLEAPRREPEPEPPRVEPPMRAEPLRAEPLREPLRSVTPPVPPQPEPEPFVEPPAAVEPPTPEPAPRFEQERLPEPKPADLPPSALNIETRTDSAPSPPRRARAEQPKDEQKQDPPSRPRLAPANGSDQHSAAFVDDILNTQERNLLRELQDELARREQQESQSSASGSWQVDRSSRHGKAQNGGPFDHPNQTTGPMIINGVPPHRPDNGYTR